MWFIAMIAYSHGVEDTRLSLAMTVPHYRTQDQCLTDAVRRTDALASVGIHGRYLCMRHGEPDRQLAVAAKRDF